MKKHTAVILAAGTLWGLMGLFVRVLTERGFDSPRLLIVRCGLSALFFGVTILIVKPAMFRVKLRHIWCFLGSGIASLLFFTYFYFGAINMMSLSAASVLLYTAPSFVMLISLFVFKEKLTKAKLAALALAFIGCVLVSGAGGSSFTPMGLVYGLCAGFGYALYSIFARLALMRGYDSKTVNFYSCLFATIGALILWGGGDAVPLMTSSWSTALWCVAMALISCYLPYLLYTYGLTGVETSKASIMASTEPVVATLSGVIVFGEALTVYGAMGVLLVLSAIVILNLRPSSAS